MAAPEAVMCDCLRWVRELPYGLRSGAGVSGDDVTARLLARSFGPVKY
jgi:hypothetical protein